MSDLLTVAEVAAILRVDQSTVRRWIREGIMDAITLPHVKWRTGYRVKQETVNAIVAKK